VTKLTETNKETNPTWSADATHILFVSNRDGNREIYRMNASGNNETNLTNDDGFDSDPAWLPGDRGFVFTSTRDGSFDLFVQELDGAGAPEGAPERLTTHPGRDLQPAVSPDGKRIAFVSDRDGDNEIFVMRANAPEGPTNKALQLTKNGADGNGSASDTAPDWSPDGRRLAFVSNRVGASDVFVMNADGTKQRNLTRQPDIANLQPVWSPSGKQIAFFRNGGGADVDVFRMRADGSRLVNLTESATREANVSWQPRPE